METITDVEETTVTTEDVETLETITGVIITIITIITIETKTIQEKRPTNKRINTIAPQEIKIQTPIIVTTKIEKKTI